MLVGRYEIEVHDGGINLPKNFDLAGKDIHISIVDEENKYVVISEVGADNGGYYLDLNVINTYITKCEKNNFVALPEEFLNLDVANKETVTVFGMLYVVEIFFEYKEPDIDVAKMEAHLKEQGLV